MARPAGVPPSWSSPKTTPVRARIEATDRSIWPKMMTSVMASAIKPSSINCDVMSKRLVTDKKYGEIVAPKAMLPSHNRRRRSSVAFASTTPCRQRLDTAELAPSDFRPA